MPSGDRRGAHREDKLNERLLMIAGVVICSLIVAIAALGIATRTRGGLVPAVNAQVRQDDHVLRCNITNTGPDRVSLSCVPLSR